MECDAAEKLIMPTEISVHNESTTSHGAERVRETELVRIGRACVRRKEEECDEKITGQREDRSERARAHPLRDLDILSCLACMRFHPPKLSH